MLLLGLLHVFPPVVVRFWSLLACLFLCGVNIASLGIEPAYFFFIFFFFFPSFPLFSFASQRSLTYSGSYSSSLASSSGSSGSRSRQSRSRSRSNNSRRSARRCAGFMGVEVVAPVFPPTYFFFVAHSCVVDSAPRVRRWRTRARRQEAAQAGARGAEAARAVWVPSRSLSPTARSW